MLFRFFCVISLVKPDVFFPVHEPFDDLVVQLKDIYVLYYVLRVMVSGLPFMTTVGHQYSVCCVIVKILY